MKKHKQWTTIISYFKNIPIDNSTIGIIKDLLKQDKNILIMIKKEDQEENPKFDAKEKFYAICELFPKETKTGKIILSIVPDINNFIKLDN